MLTHYFVQELKCALLLFCTTAGLFLAFNCEAAELSSQLFRTYSEGAPLVLGRGSGLRPTIALEDAFEIQMDPIDIADEHSLLSPSREQSIHSARGSRHRAFEDIKFANESEVQPIKARPVELITDADFQPYYSSVSLYLDLDSYRNRHRHFGTSVGIGYAFPIWTNPSYFRPRGR